MTTIESRALLRRRLFIKGGVAVSAALQGGGLYCLLERPVLASSQEPWMLSESTRWFREQGLNFRLKGQASMRWFGLLLYEARLWTADSFDSKIWTEQSFGLELIYARSFEGARIAQTSLELMQAQHGKLAERDRQWLSWMEQSFPNIEAKDRLLGLHRSGQTVCRFIHNRKPRFEVPDAAFARAFFGIWLDPRTTEPALRRRLIGEA